MVAVFRLAGEVAPIPLIYHDENHVNTKMKLFKIMLTSYLVFNKIEPLYERGNILQGLSFVRATSSHRNASIHARRGKFSKI
jgi:hypothetical protein